MKVAALYDVHAMPWALEAVLAEAQDEADAIVFGGDFVGGPFVEETLALIEPLGATLIRGNAEDERFPELPLTVELDGVVYCHATPAGNLPMTTVFTPDDALIRMFGPAGTFVIGHTHHQFDRRVGDLRIVNAGSVGMAYEGEVAAFWALVADGEPQFRKTPFDVERAIRELTASDWPSAEEFIAENLREAVSRDDAARHFESQR